MNEQDRFARQQCRAWIETQVRHSRHGEAPDSPGSNAGRGLKQVRVALGPALEQDSPGSNAGRGLKRTALALTDAARLDSPGSNAGRGLKHHLTLVSADS